MRKRQPSRPNEIKPMWWTPDGRRQYARYIERCLLLASIALLLLLLAGCSKAVSVTPMPLPPANLARQCEELPMPPEILIDPERALWEQTILSKYEICAAKQRHLVEAWQEAVQSAKK